MNKRGKSVDKTYLSVDQAEERGFIHRDYVAHCLRWSHVCKKLYEKNSYKTSVVLDVGCGRELPMAKMLYSSRLIPRHYFGVDVGPIEDSACAKIAKGKFPHTVFENTNLLEVNLEDVKIAFPKEGMQFKDLKFILPNIVTCFEVLEHVEPKMMIQMLHHLRAITSDDCRFFFSTPCWNRTDCADNHVNEMTYEALGSVFERNGFVITDVHGTFASIRDYEHLISNWVSPVTNEVCNFWQVWQQLRSYYDSNVLSCIFAPLFPAQSRNCLWELRKHLTLQDVNQKRFVDITLCSKPWGSSQLQEEMSWTPE